MTTLIKADLLNGKCTPNLSSNRIMNNS